MIAHLRHAITALVLLACLVCSHALAQTPQSKELPKLPIKEQNLRCFGIPGPGQ